MKKLEDFANIHLGKRVFVFGTGPTLNDVTRDQLNYIEKNELSIGVNFSPIHFTPNYWISGGHPTQLVFALEHLSDKTKGVFHGNQKVVKTILEGVDSKNKDKIVCAGDINANKKQNPLPIGKHVSDITGGHNILFGASHLAYIMGFTEIIYVGFEQVNRLHFYNLWPEEKQQDFKNLLTQLACKYSRFDDVVDCINEVLNVSEPDDQRWCHFKPVDVCKNLTYKSEGKGHQNYTIFKNYVDQFKSLGINVKTTATEGICVDAGAEQIELKDILV